MNDLLKIFLSLSLAGSLLILLFLLLKPLLKKHVSKLCSYYIWIIVLARLVIPFTPAESLIGTLFERIDSVQSVVQGGPASIDNAYIPAQNPAASPDLAPQASPSVLQIITVNLWIIWLVGAFTLLVRKITIYQSFVSYIKASRIPVDDIDTLERFSVILQKNRIRRQVNIYSNNLVSSPILIGFFRPCIILPTMDLSDVDFENTILHELVHCKRLDMFYKWFVQIVVCLHWFNPIVYLMRREISHACELSCDEAVLNLLDGNSRTYGDTLLNAISTNGNYKESCASVTLNENKYQLKERLEAIMNFKSKPKFAVFVAVILVAGCCIGATLVGAYKAPSKEPIIPHTSNTSSNNANNPNNDNYDYNYDYSYDGTDRNEATSVENSFSYMSERYFSKPYIIELFTHMSNEDNPFPLLDVSTNVVLSNSEACTIYYMPDMQKYAIDLEFLSALETLLNRLSQDKSRNYLLDKAVVSVVNGPYAEDVDELTQKFYSEDNIANFAAVYFYASPKTIDEYSKKAYNDNKIDYFSILLSRLSAAEQKSIADKACDDDRVDFFSIVSGGLTDADRKFFADKAYNDGMINFFSIVSGSLTDAERKVFADKAYNDDKIDFFSIVSGYLTTAERKEYADKAYNDKKTDFMFITS